MRIEDNFTNPSLEKKESKERANPRKYYYHDTLAKDFEAINTEGFRFREGLATLSVAPSFCIKHWTKAEQIIDQRRKSGRGKVYDNLDTGENRGMILIMEPKEYSVSHISSFPRETAEQVFFRNHWERHHQALHKPQNKVLLNERLRDGATRISAQKDVIPPEQIKMALMPTPALDKILGDFINDLKRGNLQEKEYAQRLYTYLESGNDILKDEIDDKKELAKEMISGELEQFIITTIRKLFLSIKYHQGKDVYTEKVDSKVSAKVFQKQEIELPLNNLRLLRVSDKLLQKYLERSISSLEKELVKL